MGAAAYELPFPDRRTAGRLLAAELASLCPERPVVLALPRGGVAVGCEIALALGAPLDVIVTRKIGSPGQPELGVGAIAEQAAVPVYDFELLYRLDLTPAQLQDEVADARAEVARQIRVYRDGRPLPQIGGRCVIVADDGLATGVTARAALRSARTAGVASAILAVPVASTAGAAAMRTEADEVVILVTPSQFRSVGEWYARFDQLNDEDVLGLLEMAAGKECGP